MTRLQDIPGYEGVSNNPIVDLTATNNTPKEGTKMDAKTYTVNGVECVDKETAMAIIGIAWPTDFRANVLSGKVVLVGEVPSKIKGSTKKVYSLESVLKTRDNRRKRGDNAPSRFEIEMYEDVLESYIKRLDGIEGMKDLVDALKGAKNLTEQRRKYNAARKE